MKFSENIYIWKPSKLFWIISSLVFLVWLYLGPIWWRHVDDFGPIQFYINSTWNIFDSYQLLDGFGSYPPIWSFWTWFSYLFNNLGLTATRYISLAMGFISTSLSSYLTMCVILNLLISLLLKNKIKINKFKYFVEIFVISFNCLNPEVMLHASSYMPYNLSTITTLTLLLMLFPFKKIDYIKNNSLYSNTVQIKKNNILFITLTTIFFSFQSIILVLSLLFTNFYLRKFKFNLINSIKYLKFNLNNIFLQFTKNRNAGAIFSFYFRFIFLTFLLLSYIYKFLILIKRDVEPGLWAKGLNNEYDLSFDNYNFLEWMLQCVKNTFSIIGQSIYPFRYYQNEASLVISFIFLLSIFFIFKYEVFGKTFLINLGSVFLISILLSSFGNFVFAPTRHTIFLYPYIWISIILLLSNLYIYLIKTWKFNSSKILILLSIFIFLFSNIGLINSHKLIQYDSETRNNLVKMASKADFYIDNLYFIRSFSQFPSHGSLEFESVKNKQCSIEKLTKNSQFKIFIYSHRSPFEKENIVHLKDLVNFSNGCIKETDKVEVIEKYEKNNFYDFEQNNKIFNGGSGSYGYLLEVNK